MTPAVHGDKTAIALHTAPGLPPQMHPVVALVKPGLETDVLGLTYREYTDVERKAVTHAHPRTNRFKEAIIQAFYAGIRDKPETTFENVKARRPGGPRPPHSGAETFAP